MDEKLEKYLNALGWTEEEFIEFLGYKNLDTFQRSSGAKKKVEFFVEVFELVYFMLLNRLKL